MDIVFPLIAVCVLLVFSLIWLFGAERLFAKIGFSSLAVVALWGLVMVISEWEQATDYDAKQYELVDKLPFEWNKAQQKYYFYHEDEWKSAEAFVNHFDQSMVESDPDYDSCMVYKVTLPKVMSYFDTRYWSEDYEYRQSEDILLLSREKKKIEMK